MRLKSASSFLLKVLQALNISAKINIKVYFIAGSKKSNAIILQAFSLKIKSFAIKIKILFSKSRIPRIFLLILVGIQVYCAIIGG